jgi:hypothetical protein
VVEGTSLLRKHTGLTLYLGFESLALRHVITKEIHLTLLEKRSMKYNTAHAPVAQLDRVLGYEPRGRAFESLRAHQIPVVKTKAYSLTTVGLFLLTKQI